MERGDDLCGALQSSRPVWPLSVASTTTAMAMSQPDSRPGHLAATHPLLQRLSQTFGVTVKVAHKENQLHLLLEAEEVPAQQVLVEAVQRVIPYLQPEGVEQIRIYGRRIGEKTAAWYEAIALSALLSPDPKADSPSSDPLTAMPPADSDAPPPVSQVDPAMETQPPLAEESDPVLPDPWAPMTDPVIEPIAPVENRSAAGVEDASANPWDSLPEPISDPILEDPLILASELVDLMGPPATVADAEPETPAANPWDNLPDPVVEPDLEGTQPTLSEKLAEPFPALTPPATPATIPSDQKSPIPEPIKEPAPSPSPELQSWLQKPEALVLVLFSVVFVLWQAYISLLDEVAPQGSLSNRALAERLGVSPTTLRQRRAAEDFPQWSQALDPDGISWAYQKGVFVPV